MEGYRQGRPGDEGQILDLANMVFSMAHRPHDFAQLLPKVYAQPGFAPKHVVYAGPKGELLALVGLHTIDLRLEDQSLRCGIIGTVCVHPQHRGKGHMKHLMPMAEEMARQQGCQLMLLGGQRQRYNFFGFEQGGIIARLEVTRTNLRLAGVTDPGDITFVTLEQAPPVALDQVYQRYQTQQMVGERTLEEFARVLRSYDGQGYAILRGNTTLGYLYAVDGHWQGFALEEEDMLPTALAAWQNIQKQRSTRVVLGLHQRQLLRQIGDMAEGAALADSLMMRVLDWQTVLQKLMRFRHQGLPLAEGDTIVSIDGQRLRIQGSSRGVMVKPTRDKPLWTLTHNQAVTRMFSLSATWQQGTQDPGGWFPLWFSLPMADGF